eukprot:Cvel_32560.t1-p1 / transcript=Cvel_32560.t1 / gene=Cvel_32560 / organism=Chromera_velia_CCMP2878 / gene_product=Transmembrane 9 superfamily member 1, putative / transcript_product=Transmembrane 9 superfamily member 1, putative / location=Cvel_scaffold5094:3369-6145(+) / protein_length=232 / sequence_SO=supercontig / SO=protein_coding / is_pseudo=false
MVESTTSAGTSLRKSPQDPIAVSYGQILSPSDPAKGTDFLSFPFCHPKECRKPKPLKGKPLRGECEVSELYAVSFEEPVTGKAVCKRTVSVSELSQLGEAIDGLWESEFFVDDLRVVVPIGVALEDPSREGKPKRRFLLTHHDFVLEVSRCPGGRGRKGFIASASVRAGMPGGTVDMDRLIEEGGGEVEFLYSVSWTTSEAAPASRLLQSTGPIEDEGGGDGSFVGPLLLVS